MSKTQPAAGTVSHLPADPSVRLEMIEAALYALASGQHRTQVRHGDYWVEYSQGSVAFLERERARLQAIVGKRNAITIGRTSGC